MRPQYFLIALTIVTIFFMLQLFDPFLKPLFVALLLAVATNSLNIYFKHHISNNFLSTSLITILLTTIFFVPVLYCIFSFATLINKIDQKALVEIFNVTKNWVENIPDDFIFFKDQLTNMLEKIDIPSLIQNLFSFGAFLGKNSAKFIIDMVMILIFFFFFTFYSTGLAHYFKEALPLKMEDSNALFYESSNVMSVVLYSILATAVLEGFLFGIFVSFFDYDGILLGVLYGFASLVPVVGGMIMWLPVAIYEIFAGSSANAIAIALYSIIVISVIADTFIKPIIIKYINKRIVRTPTKVNELLIFFAIVAGLSTFGFWGMIIGPAMVTFFISLMQLLKKFSDDFYSFEQTVENRK
ncbi:AI-2E family transporter [Halarcobacter anaerophilus]|uniref:AI-2E family transporter n=1 Tax=Halarcobacter anaerophilus TaxID=877500 RepID=A0A4V1LPY2_9BACT|nr:AI-2E family transporter [Halarcobacter anaerophilus]QDF29825.1 acid membrane antigen A [Halarcobacter anaerophilus]RXJ62788.1 AI-2E family transporter [Halarcobacter anaerophilus]